MIKLLIHGALGKMGQAVAACAKEHPQFSILGGIDQRESDSSPFPIYASLDLLPEKPDCIIDFSNPASLGELLSYSISQNVPLVLCTTGFSPEQLTSIQEASTKIPLFFSANMSLGVNLLIALAKKATSVLGSQFDIEIIERHHNKKLDAPSGTALAIADAINEVAETPFSYEYNRSAYREPRRPNSIGIHSVRGGNIVGIHEVLFAGENETVSLIHEATSRSVFATGAVNAAAFLVKQPPGLYNMEHLINKSV